MEPNFSDAISRFVKKFIKKSAGNSLPRKRTKTAGRVQRRIINDESIENNNFEFENSLSQDKTEYLIKQGELVSEKFDLMSSKNFEQEIDQHSKSQFAVDDSYNLKSTSIF